MMPFRMSARVLGVATILALLCALSMGASSAGAGNNLQGELEPGFQGESGIPPDFDRRSGRRAVTDAQESRAAALGAAVRWNRFGTPQSLISYDGALDSGIAGDPVSAAKSWLRQNATLF